MYHSYQQGMSRSSPTSPYTRNFLRSQGYYEDSDSSTPGSEISSIHSEQPHRYQFPVTPRSTWSAPPGMAPRDMAPSGMEACADADTSLKQSFLVASPKREVIVDVSVDPQPLIETENGEALVCDFSFNVTPTDRRRIPAREKFRRPALRPRKIRFLPGIKRTESVAPAQTPTTRRQGMFTPAGIFKRGHFNVRRVPGEIDPLTGIPFSPLPEPGPPSPDLFDDDIEFDDSDDGSGSDDDSGPPVHTEQSTRSHIRFGIPVNRFNPLQRARGPYYESTPVSRPRPSMTSDRSQLYETARSQFSDSGSHYNSAGSYFPENSF